MSNAFNTAMGILKVVDRSNGTERWYDFFEDHSVESIYAVIESNTHSGEQVHVDDVIQLRWEGWNEEYTADTSKKYQAWVDEQLLRGDTTYYAAPKEDFFRWIGFEKASRLGKKYVIMENLS